MAKAASSTAHVSRHCDEGRHERCLGTVYIYPPEGDKRIVDCACPSRDCGHGSDYEKARRRREAGN